MTTYTSEQVIRLLKREIKKSKSGTNTELARRIGITGPFLGRMLNGFLPPQGKVLTYLGMQRVVRFQRVRRKTRRSRQRR